MKKTEKILCIAIFIAILMKLFKMPGASIINILSLLSLSTLYFVGGFALFNNIEFKQILFKNSYDGISKLRIIGSISLGLCFSFLCIAIMYELQNWPNAEVGIFTGLFFLGIIAAVAFFRYQKNKATFYHQLFTRIAIIGGIALTVNQLTAYI